jgi:hypothetical protein
MKDWGEGGTTGQRFLGDLARGLAGEVDGGSVPSRM